MSKFTPKIVEFKPGSRAREIQDDIIKHLRTFLREAKMGKYTGIMIVATERDKGMASVSSMTDDIFTLIGAVEGAKQDLLNDRNPDRVKVAEPEEGDE